MGRLLVRLYFRSNLLLSLVLLCAKPVHAESIIGRWNIIERKVFNYCDSSTPQTSKYVSTFVRRNGTNYRKSKTWGLLRLKKSGSNYIEDYSVDSSTSDISCLQRYKTKYYSIMNGRMKWLFTYYSFCDNGDSCRSRYVGSGRKIRS